MRIVHVYPDRITKVLPDEPLTFYVTVEAEKGPARHFEVWTDIPTREFPKGAIGGYAVPLALTEKQEEFHIYSGTVHPTRTGFYEFSVRYKKGSKWTWRGGNTRRRTRTPIHVEPAWTTGILYNTFVRQFGAEDKDGDGIIQPGEGGTFADLINRMHHFKKLNITAIYLNPIQMTGELFRYEEAGRQYYENNLTNQLPLHMHPGSVYAIKEYKSIDPELGLNPDDTETDQYLEFRRFCEECHKNGIRVILDVVFDHTSRDSFLQRIHPEWFVYKIDPKSLEGDFITRKHPEAGGYWGKPEHAFTPYDHGVFWGDCTFLNWNYYYGLQTWAPDHELPPPNPDIENMREYFKSVLRYWIKNYGVDGFRLDVAYAVPTDFWHEAIQESRTYAHRICKRHKLNPQAQPMAPLSPDLLFIGETYVDKVEELQECGISMLNGDFAWKLFDVASPSTQLKVPAAAV